MNPYHDNVKKNFFYQGLCFALAIFQNDRDVYVEQMCHRGGYKAAINAFAKHGSHLLSNSEHRRIADGEMPGWAVEVIRATELHVFEQVFYDYS